MKMSWTRWTSLLLVAGASLILVSPVLAEDVGTDRLSVSYYHRFSGSGGPPLIISHNQYDPYSYETFLQNKRGVEFGYRSAPNMTIHARIEHNYDSSHQEITNWSDDTFYAYTETDYTYDLVSHDWNISADVMFEPFASAQHGPVRAILGVGPFISLVKNDSEYTSKQVFQGTPRDVRISSSTDETMGMLIGLRGIIGAEWWIKDRIGLVCQTGFEAALFTSTTDNKSKHEEENSIDPYTSWDKEEYQQNGWLAYNQQVMLGVRVKF